jgi:hypothetical protein
MPETCIHCGGPIRYGQPKIYAAYYTDRKNEHPAHMYLSACVVSLRERIELMEGGKETNPANKGD